MNIIQSLFFFLICHGPPKFASTARINYFSTVWANNSKDRNHLFFFFFPHNNAAILINY
jgi:uncharacterized membrane protein SpoIIM required for sporulation